MIGYMVKGKDLDGHQCQGMIHDKVVTPQIVFMTQPGEIGPGRPVPMPLDAYIVIDDNTRCLHLVAPRAIIAVGIPTEIPANA